MLTSMIYETILLPNNELKKKKILYSFLEVKVDGVQWKGRAINKPPTEKVEIHVIRFLFYLIPYN